VTPAAGWIATLRRGDDDRVSALFRRPLDAHESRESRLAGGRVPVAK